MGKPLKFDEPTSKLEPLKYAAVQVELEYSVPRPPSIWVPVINSDEVEEKERVDIFYPQMPYSCSLCKAFGHSLARRADNPDAPLAPRHRTLAPTATHRTLMLIIEEPGKMFMVIRKHRKI